MIEDHKPGHKEPYKDRQSAIIDIRQSVEAGIGKPLPEIIKGPAQETIFIQALRYVTTTKKAVCVALGLPVEGCCWYKRHHEVNGSLWQVKQERCPITRRIAWTLTTDPDKAPKPDEKQSTQLNLLDLL